MSFIYQSRIITLILALSASKLLIPVAYIVAGLRSFNMSMPEEQNRLLTDHISSLLFLPSQSAERILRNEMVTRHIFLSGDIMYDAVLCYSHIAQERSVIIKRLGIVK